MEVITSQDNQIYKLCRKLEQKKHRDKEGMYLIEGDNLIMDALSCGASIEKVIFHEDYGGPVLGMIEERGHEFVFMKGSLFDKVAQTETSQGVLAAVRKKELSPESFMAQAKERAYSFGAGGSSIVVLDRLQDPGNLGTIIRTADAAGYGGVMAVKGTGDVYSPKVVRSAAGSLFRIPVLYVEDAETAAGLLREHGKKIFVTCFDTENRYYDADLSEDVGLVIGNEGNGISDEMIGMADEKIKIPMEGSIDSLNAAVAAGILMYASVQQRMQQTK